MLKTVQQNEMQVIQSMEIEPIKSEDLRTRVKLVQQVMEDVMQEGTHYGIIPGCGDKPTLLKAGSEVLLMTFRIALNIKSATNISTDPDELHYQVVVTGTHQGTGAILGEGIGSSSSYEEKYKWRRAVCDEEYNATPENRRRIKYGKKSGGHYTVKQIRTEIADVANTVLKMGKKRAQIDFTLTQLAASDIFTQDLEDIPHVSNVPKKESPPIDPTPVDPLIMQELQQAQSEEELLAMMKVMTNGMTDQEKKRYHEPFRIRKAELKREAA